MSTENTEVANTDTKPYSLQKLPHSKDFRTPIEKFVIDLLQGKQTITKEEYSSYDNVLQESLINTLIYAFGHIGYNDRDRLLELIDEVIPEDAKRKIWEINHVAILNTLNRLTKELNRFPARCEIADATGFSRQTINKHLKEYYGSKQHQEKEEEFLLLREKLLSRVYRFAVDGDLKAAKVFLDSTNNSYKSVSIKNQQNNYIQINGITITESQLLELPEDQYNALYDALQRVNPSITKTKKQTNETF